MTNRFAAPLPASLSLVHEDRLTLECWLECFAERAPEVSVASAWVLPLLERDIRGALAPSVLLGASDPRRSAREAAAIRRSGRVVHVLTARVQDSLFDDPPAVQPFDLVLIALRHPLVSPPAKPVASSAPTAREMHVARLFVAGSSIEEIGRELAISRHTVQTHLMNLRRRLDGDAAKGREALAFHLNRRGWLGAVGTGSGAAAD